MKKVANGNTAIGVNQAIINYLLEQNQNHKSGSQFLDSGSALDLPCGHGDFLLALKEHFPGLSVQGKDLYETPLPEAKPFFTQAGVDQWAPHSGQKFDLISCISGVMVFDNIVAFIEQCSAHLKPGGTYVITNDNVLTARDRVSWLLWGRLRRFKKFYNLDEGNWNVVLIQALVRFCIKNDIEIQKIEYVTIRWEDLFFAPLAILLYPLQVLSLFKAPAYLPLSLRYQMFSFKSLMARHYIIYGKKKS